MSQMAVAQVRKPVQSPPSPASGVLQRKYDKDRNKRPLLQRAAVSSVPETVPPIVHEVLRSPGQPLDAETRAFMEPRFGHDFSRVSISNKLHMVNSELMIGQENDIFEQEADQLAENIVEISKPLSFERPDFSRIRVHTEDKAAESAEAIGARAYTFGQHIVFGKGHYNTSTGAGRKLLAHELTHTMQQCQSLSNFNGKLIQLHPDLRYGRRIRTLRIRWGNFEVFRQRVRAAAIRQLDVPATWIYQLLHVRHDRDLSSIYDLLEREDPLRQDGTVTVIRADYSADREVGRSSLEFSVVRTPPEGYAHPEVEPSSTRVTTEQHRSSEGEVSAREFDVSASGSPEWRNILYAANNDIQEHIRRAQVRRRGVLHLEVVVGPDHVGVERSESSGEAPEGHHPGGYAVYRAAQRVLNNILLTGRPASRRVHSITLMRSGDQWELQSQYLTGEAMAAERVTPQEPRRTGEELSDLFRRADSARMTRVRVDLMVSPDGLRIFSWRATGHQAPRRRSESSAQASRSARQAADLLRIQIGGGNPTIYTANFGLRSGEWNLRDIQRLAEIRTAPESQPSAAAERPYGYLEEDELIVAEIRGTRQLILTIEAQMIAEQDPTRWNNLVFSLGPFALGRLSRVGRLARLGRLRGLMRVRRIAGTRGLLHSFDRHAREWFGRIVGRETHMAQWQGLIERAARSRQVFEWRLGSDRTIAHLARIEGRYFSVHFFRDGPRAGELATAFVPHQRQLTGMLRAIRGGR